jgi:hypothetical protein
VDLYTFKSGFPPSMRKTDEGSEAFIYSACKHGQRKKTSISEDFPCLSGNFLQEGNELFHTSRKIDQIKNHQPTSIKHQQKIR